MSLNSNLPISRLITVGVELTPQAAQAQNLSDLLILGSSDVIDVTERIRTYESLAAVSSDFGTVAPEYLAALLWFSQAPQPTELKIGRWAQTNTKGKLVGGTLPANEQLVSFWTAIANGSFHVAIDGGGAQSLTGLNFSGVTTLNGVAAVISAVLTGAVMTYNANFQRFEIESNTSGASSSVSFVTAGTGGTDISTDLVMTNTAGNGAYQAPGMVAETALAAATLFDANYGQSWYALVIIGASDADHQLVGPAIEAMNNKHIYGVTTQEAGALSAASTTDIVYLLQQLDLTRTFTQYSSSNPYAVCSAFGRALTVDYNGQNTVIDLMYKQEPVIVPESLNPTQIAALEAKNGNVFVAYNNQTAIIERGTMASGDYLDEITGTDWLAVTIMTAIYNLLFQSPTKIPQTDAGNHLITVTIASVCSQGVRNGLLAAGVWDSQGFGTLNQGDFLPNGFYIFAPPIALQSASDRGARKSVLFQVAAKLAGSIQTVDVLINVNR